MVQKLLLKVVDAMEVVRFVLVIVCISIKKKKKKCLTEKKICDIIIIEIKERGKNMNVFEVMRLTTEIVNMCDNRKDKIMCQYCAHQKLCEYLDKELDKTIEK